MSNYGGLALWQTALGDSILGYVAQMLKLLLGWCLALEDALVDEIRNVVHYVFAHPSLSRCAVRRRQFCRRSLCNSSGVLGCGVHMLDDAARRCRLSLGLALLNAKSPGAHSLSQALVLGPRTSPRWCLPPSQSTLPMCASGTHAW
jgi:hypothetical protein